MFPTAPNKIVDANGQVCFGQYAGAPSQIDWSGLRLPYRRNRLWQYFHHKHWQYIALATDELFCGVAIVDVGWANTAFAYVFDRWQGKMLFNFSQDGLPGISAKLNPCPAIGAASHFRFLGNRIQYQQLAGGEQYQLELHSGDVIIHAIFDAKNAAPCLLAIGEVSGGSVHATVKSPGMPLRGVVSVAGREFDLSNGVASFDHSNGFLARETSWRWASAHSLELGFNVQSGYFGNTENVLWVDGQLIALDTAHFEFNPTDILQPWHIYTDDGLLDLMFQPEGCRSENKNLLVAASRYAQPIGTFSGSIKTSAKAMPRRIEHLVGVTEDHFSRW
jgi:hypothetical protein